MKKITSKILKETLNDYIIERDKKAFSILFTGDKFNGNPFNFTSFSLFNLEQNYFSDEKLSYNKNLKNLKNEIFFLGKKMQNESQNRKIIKEKIEKNELNSKLYKITQLEYKQKLDEIFSEF